MSDVYTVARQEVFALRRERMPMMMLGIFSTMVGLSGLIGFLTKNTVSNVWSAISAQGLSTSANPFAEVSALYFARNAVIYIVLIGTLMAIIAGVSSALRDRKAHTTDLILSRPLSQPSFVFGKLAGIGSWLVLVLGSLWVLASVMLSIINGSLLSASEYFAVGLMFLLALPLLWGYAALGLFFGFVSARETSALVTPVSIWAFLTFVIPQVGTAAQPISLLNPVPAVATTGGVFDAIGPVMGMFAVSERFKTAAGLALQDSNIAGNFGSSVATLVVFSLVASVALFLVRRDTIRGVFSE